MRKKYILVIGSVNADILIEIDRLPALGETIAASTPHTGTFSPGGKGANQAAGVARLARSLQAKFACQFGNDTHGENLKQILHNEKVDISLSGEHLCPSGQAFIFLYPSGDNSIIIVGGANSKWSIPLSKKLQNAVKEATIVLLQSEIPSEINGLVTTLAYEHNVPVMWDTGGEDRAVPKELLSKISFLCPNETEISRLVGFDVKNKEDAIAAARQIQSQGGQNVIITLGSNGSIFVPSNSSETPTFQPCYSVEKVVDTTGAGDSYRSAFAVAFAEGKSICECMQFAAAASALTIQTKGALNSLPTSEQVEEFLQHNKRAKFRAY
jgi:ribokinase